MNDQQFAERIRQALEESSERVPYRVSHRLERARRAALERVPAGQAEAVLVPAPAGRIAYPAEDVPLRRRSRAAAVLSLMILVAGLVALSIWTDLETADETADVDMAVLTDEEVPISGYADRGFGVFLKNTQQ